MSKKLLRDYGVSIVDTLSPRVAGQCQCSRRGHYYDSDSSDD
jgi:hypothetical protein